MSEPQTAQDWVVMAQQYLQQAEALWAQPGSREPVVMCLVHAAERLLNGAMVQRGRQPVSDSDLPTMVARAKALGCRVASFAPAAKSLDGLYTTSRYGFLGAQVTWAALGGLREAVERLRAELFPCETPAVTYGGVLVCISGPSGVGKSTICRRLVERLDALLSVSLTTRPKRENEADGRDYTFVTRAEFERRLERGELLEYARVYGGHYYGTPAGPVLEALKAGRAVILEIEIEGTIQVVRRFPDAVTVYVLAPTADDQQRRLVGRQEDSEAAIRERLSKADGEIRYAKDCGVYTHFVVNADLDETVEKLAGIIRAKKKTVQESANP